MDAQALLTPDAVDRYMGVPLAHVPAPEGSAAPSYARYFVGELFMGTFAGLGIHPDIYWMSELYGDGSMDPYIRTALDRAEVVRDIYLRVSNVERPPGWLPLSVICEVCGKVGTTLATDWDGETVAYACKPDHVDVGDGLRQQRAASRRSAGRAKLPFNVDWAAKWSHFDVTVEGCGKDLATTGGSRDRSDAISREVFEREPPLNVALRVPEHRRPQDEHVEGHAARPRTRWPTCCRRSCCASCSCATSPGARIDFDPEGDTIPGLFDEFDRVAAATAGQPVARRAAARSRAHLRGRASSTPTRTSRPRRPASGRRSATSRCSSQVPGRRPRGAHRGGEGRAARRCRAGDPRGARRASRARWLDGFAPERYRVAVQDDAARPAPPG